MAMLYGRGRMIFLNHFRKNTSNINKHSDCKYILLDYFKIKTKLLYLDFTTTDLSTLQIVVLLSGNLLGFKDLHSAVVVVGDSFIILSK